LSHSQSILKLNTQGIPDAYMKGIPYAFRLVPAEKYQYSLRLVNPQPPREKARRTSSQVKAYRLLTL
jgi:hypothetical protein